MANDNGREILYKYLLKQLYDVSTIGWHCFLLNIVQPRLCLSNMDASYSGLISMQANDLVSVH